MSAAKNTSGSYFLEAGGMIEMPSEAIDDLTRPGNRMESAAYWERHRGVRFDCSVEDMRAELRSIGFDAEDVRGMTSMQVRRAMLWAAAGFIMSNDDGCDAEDTDDAADAAPVEAGSSCTDREECNGWTNWATWNVSLWMLNEEPLYRVVQDGVRNGKSIKEIVEECFPSGATPDGASIAEVDLDDMQCIIENEQQG